MINTQAHDTRQDLYGKPLSKCQLAILKAFCETGKRDKELAFTFGLSIQTVKNQLQFIRHKTGCKNRSELMLWYNLQKANGIAVKG